MRGYETGSLSRKIKIGQRVQREAGCFIFHDQYELEFEWDKMRFNINEESLIPMSAWSADTSFALGAF